MRRHGGLVWGVCRRSLAREQDAEDAFQATFLVLSRKAEAIRAGQSLPSWLFGVARRSALLIRQRANRPMPPREPLPTPSPSDEASSAEACEIILDEVRRLPEKHRLPLLLCGLEGLTKAEAARRLGWKEGTVSGRLGRARQRLRERLERRGLLATDGTIPTLASTVPGRLFAATLQTAREMTVPRPFTPLPFPAVLAQEVIGSMRLTTRTFLVSVLVSGLLVLAAAGAVYYKTVSAAVPVVAEPPPEADPASPRWQERLRLQGYLGGAYREFTPNGRLMATIDGRDVLRFLDTTTWQERARCELTRTPNATCYPQWQAFSPDGKFFVLWWRVPGKDKGAKPLVETWLIEAATGKIRHVLAGSHPEFIPSSKLLALRRGNDLVLWDYAAAAEVRVLAGMPTGWLKCSSPDGKFLYVPTAGGSGKLWEVATGKEIATLEGFQATWAKDGKSLATVLPGPVVKLWDLPTGKLRATLQGFNQPGCGLELSPDSRLLLTSVSDYGLKPDGEIEMPATLGKPYRPKRRPLDVRLWEAATGRELLRLPGEIDLCRNGFFSPDGKTIAYQRLTEDPGYLMEGVLWDVAAGKERLVLRPEGGLDGLLFSPDGTVLFGNTRSNGRASLRLWDVATGRPLPSVPGTRDLQYHPGIRFSPDGKILTLDFVMPGGAVGKPVPEELRVYQWSAATLTAETRGEPFPPEPQKEEPPPKPSSAAAKAYEALKNESESADRGFAERFTAAKSDKDRQSAQRDRNLALEGFTARALEIARKDPQDPAAVDALEFALRMTSGMGGKLGELGRAAVEQVRRDYLDSLTLDRFLHWLSSHHTKAADDLLRAAFERSPHRTVRGRAGYQLAHSLADRAEAARLLRQLPELADHPFLKEQAESLAFLRGTDSEATDRQAEAIYERLRKDYADVTQYDSQPTPLGEVAQRGLFALRNLAIGKTAPDIDGADLDGRKFRLSDYRGKVVLLVFCGYWCGPCREMNPHKQALIRRYAGKPFAVLEVNSDDPGEWKRVMKKEGYTWRCWADGKDGPIAKKWDVSRWPTIFVLDRKGVIRYKELPSEVFEKAVDALLGEAAAN
jgi:RNA polymerase sigma factor (sigma-70 family)